MSVMFCVYIDGKKCKGYKYEDLFSIWFTQTNEKPPSPQISIVMKSTKDATYSSWKHTEDDLERTQKIIDAAQKEYSKYIVEIECKKRKAHVIDITHDPKILKE